VAGKIIPESLRLIKESSLRCTLINSLIMICRSFFPLVVIFMLKRLVDMLVSQPAVTSSFFQSLILFIVVIAIILLADDLLAIAGRYYARAQSGLLEAHLLGKIHTHAASLGLASFEDASFHELLGRAAGDALWRPAAIISDLILMLRGAVSFIVMAVILSRFSVIIVIVIIIAFIPAFLSQMAGTERLHQLRPQKEKLSRKWEYFSWLITGERPAREIKLFGLGNYFDNLFRKQFDEARDLELKTIRRSGFFEAGAALFRALFFAGIIIFFSLSLVKGKITAGEMAMYLVAFRQAMIYLRDTMSGITGIEEDRLFLRDFFDFLGRKEDIYAKEPVESLPETDGDIEISGLTFFYPGSATPALKDINIRIGKGEKIAIVGSNGSGKSTLVKLLCRLYDPDNGEIRYSGVPVTHIDPAAYRKCFSVVFQDFMLYYLSVRENIGLSDLCIDPMDEKLREIFIKAGLDIFTDELPGGFDTRLGHIEPGGKELSWGEWQKIAIVRALFRQAPVLILDEPSSSLDANSESEIFSHLDDITAGRTTVFISHRLSNVIKADRIIVLNNGVVAETGTHMELIEKDGLYSRMYLRQKNMYM
jgi:ATP-binding cassette, subfamily B, bacterial